MLMQMGLKFTQRVTILQTVSNQKVTLKKLISMLWIAQKLYVRTQSDLCEIYKLFIQNVGKGICLLEKKVYFVYTGNI